MTLSGAPTRILLVDGPYCFVVFAGRDLDLVAEFGCGIREIVSMANEEHLARLKEGSKRWHAWRVQNPDIRPDLRGAQLQHTDFSDFNLHKADLSNANLIGTNLQQADLSFAELQNANLIGAELQKANLRDAKLQKANLSLRVGSQAFSSQCECRSRIGGRLLTRRELQSRASRFDHVSTHGCR